MLANRLYVLLSLAFASAIGVSAQTPNLDSCILNCITQAVGNSTCTSFNDIACVCSSPSFQTTAASCLQANCTTQDQQTAAALRAQECGTSSTASGTGTSAKAGSTASSSSSTTSTSKPNSAPIVTEQLPFLTAVIAIAGVALGGAFAL